MALSPPTEAYRPMKRLLPQSGQEWAAGSAHNSWHTFKQAGAVNAMAKTS